MKGSVKWFSSEKGYGFLSDEYGEDRYFNIKSVLDSKGLRSGSEVEFEAFEGKKGLAANNVKTIKKINVEYLNSRAMCLNCGKHMVPRIITGPPNTFFYQERWVPVPHRSVCPFCGHTYEEFLMERSRSYILFRNAVAILIPLFFIFVLFR